MELWVRTQNKGDLLKIYNITIDSRRNLLLGNLISNDNASICDYWELGRYKTTERALEVLDEIHQRLIDLQTMEIDPSCWKTIKRNINCVYEMPEE